MSPLSCAEHLSFQVVQIVPTWRPRLVADPALIIEAQVHPARLQAYLLWLWPKQFRAIPPKSVGPLIEEPGNRLIPRVAHQWCRQGCELQADLMRSARHELDQTFVQHVSPRTLVHRLAQDHVQLGELPHVLIRVISMVNLRREQRWLRVKSPPELLIPVLDLSHWDWALAEETIHLMVLALPYALVVPSSSHGRARQDHNTRCAPVKARGDEEVLPSALAGLEQRTLNKIVDSRNHRNASGLVEDIRVLRRSNDALLPIVSDRSRMPFGIDVHPDVRLLGHRHIHRDPLSLAHALDLADALVPLALRQGVSKVHRPEADELSDEFLLKVCHRAYELG
mmetsp:Transcript_10708/g.26242  ORF Transcript_10708/g.26242 Transcript_10708/m.26242 type:complete len:338 (-) Transcript_10708:51-1064(-)